MQPTPTAMPLIEGENNRGAPTVDVLSHLLLRSHEFKKTPPNDAPAAKPVALRGLLGRRPLTYDNSYCSDANHGWFSLEERSCACGCTKIH